MNVDNAIQAAWVAAWELAAKYHRYEVEGIENLDAQPALIAGYHGRSLASDLCILSVKLKQRLGYLPHCFVHRSIKMIPGVTHVVDALGFLSQDDEAIAEAVQRREHILVPPGGAAEGMRSYHNNYRVYWPSFGYAKLAVRYGLPIVPVAAAGADDTYIGLLDGEDVAARLGLPAKWAWAPWTGIGPLGLYPFSPPFPTRIYQVIGEPIPTAHLEVTDNDAIAQLHGQVTKTVQNLLTYALDARANRR